MKRHKICRQVNLHLNQVISFTIYLASYLAAFGRSLQSAHHGVENANKQKLNCFLMDASDTKYYLEKVNKPPGGQLEAQQKSFICSKPWSFQHRTIGIGRSLRRLLEYVCTETAGHGTAYLI